MNIRGIANCARNYIASSVNGTPECRNPSASPNVRTIIFVRRTGANGGNYCEYVQPDPLVSLVSQQDVIRFATISNYSAESQDLSVKGLSRETYSQQFIDDLTGIIVDGAINPDDNSEWEGGELYAIEAIAEGTTLTWDLILRKKTLSM